MHLAIFLSKKLLSLRSLSNNQSNDSDTDSTGINFVTSWKANRIKFGIFLVLQFFAVCCFLNAFFQYLYRRKLRQTLSYHIIFLLLLTSFLFVTIALPLTEAYLFTSYVYPSNDLFCSLWTWFHYSVNIINLFLMAYISIERHLIIFHGQILQNKLGKYLLHYCPICFCLIYPPTFYVGAIFLCPCTNTYDYTQLLCTWPCYFGNYTWSNIDLFFNNYTPLLTIPIFCFSLYIRVFYQKRSMRLEANKWRRDKKHILQLFAISSLYLLMWMPLQIAGLVNIYWDPAFLVQAQIDYMYLFPYFIHLIYPFIVIFTMDHKNRIDNQQVLPVQPNNAPALRIIALTKNMS